MTPTGGPGSPTPDASLDRVTVLLVDDDEAWARTTGRLLAETRDEFAVETANSLAAGRDRFASLDPDCVVCDYQLGDGTGLDMLEAVREVDPDRPFVLVTGRGSETVASDAIGRGVSDYIRKDREDSADLLVGRVANAVGTYRTERALERERHSKNAMLDILTATTGRADLLQQFCTQLVEDRGYASAWIGTTTASGALVPQASAGRDDYLDEPGVPRSDGGEGEAPPWVGALGRDEPVVVAPIDGSARSAEGDAGWQRAARACGFDCVAAFPIRHDGVRFGVLVVSGTDSTAVDDRERRFLVEYAETVGYALQAAEWKRSLLSEHPVEIDVEVADDAVPLVAFAERVGPDARVEALSALDRGDGRTLLLTRIEGATVDEIHDAAAEVASLEALDVDGEVSPTRCEFLVDSPTPETVLAGQGARFDRTVVERGTATVTALVPDDGTVQQLADALEAVYDDAEVARIWTERTGRRDRLPDDPLEPLTDRQREVIQYAFHHGYFELPRSTSGIELAETFDIARATLTQHLRSAERKLLGQLLGR